MMKSTVSLLRTVSRTRATFKLPTFRFSTKASTDSSTLKPVPSFFEYRGQVEDLEIGEPRIVENVNYLPILIGSLKHSFNDRTLAYAIILASKESKTPSDEGLLKELHQLIEKNIDSIERPNTFVVALRTTQLVNLFTPKFNEKFMKRVTTVFKNSYTANETGTLIAYLFFILYKRNVEFPIELLEFIRNNSLKLAFPRTLDLLLYISSRATECPEVYQKLIENLKIIRIALTGEELPTILYLWSVGKLGGEKVMKSETCDLLLELANRTLKNIELRVPISEASYSNTKTMINIVNKITSGGDSQFAQFEQKFNQIPSSQASTSGQQTDSQNSKAYLDIIINHTSDPKIKSELEKLCGPSQ